MSKHKIYKRHLGKVVLLEGDAAIEHLAGLLLWSLSINDKCTCYADEIGEGMLASQACLIFDQHPDKEGLGKRYE
jgi:hypothetical protein